MRLARSNNRLLGIVAAVLAMGTVSVLISTDSANAAKSGVDLRPEACVVVEQDQIPEQTITETITKTVTKFNGTTTVTETVTTTVTANPISDVIGSVTKTLTDYVPPSTLYNTKTLTDSWTKWTTTTTTITLYDPWSTGSAAGTVFESAVTDVVSAARGLFGGSSEAQDELPSC